MTNAGEGVWVVCHLYKDRWGGGTSLWAGPGGVGWGWWMQRADAHSALVRECAELGPVAW